jgi:hypothetical protein
MFSAVASLPRIGVCPGDGNQPSSEETMEAFKSYSWPGNIRELQNMLERAVILANDGVLPNPLPPPPLRPIANVGPQLATPATPCKFKFLRTTSMMHCSDSVDLGYLPAMDAAVFGVPKGKKKG